MSLSRVKTWSTGEILTSADLNAEFNNILNNPVSLISPLTANLAYGGFRATGLSAGSVSSPSLQPTGDTNTGIYFSGADTVDIAAGGVRSATFTTATTAVNYLVVTPSATTDPVIVDVEGTDTDIDLKIDTKGAGVIDLYTGATLATKIARTATAVNYFVLTPAAAGSPPALSVAGSDTNVGLIVDTQADGDLDLRTNGVERFYIDSNGTIRQTAAATNSHRFLWTSGGSNEIALSNEGGPYISITGELASEIVTGPTDGCVLYCTDNGSGKTQFRARFQSGSSVIIATEP